MGRKGLLRNNPERICFGCSDKITNKQPSAYYCNGCFKMLQKIRGDFIEFIYRKKLKSKYKGYTFKVTIHVVKMR